MKIEKIEKLSFGPNKFKISLVPNRLERFFGYKPKEITLYNTGNVYSFGGGTVWADEDGNEFSNENWIGTALDRYILKERLKAY
jgi:hypothetical protein